MRFSTQTRRATGATATAESTTVVFTVLLHQKLLVFEYQPLDLPQIMPTNAAIIGKNNGTQPILALSVRRTHMDMGRFVGFIRIKMKSKRTNPKNRRHPLYATTGQKKRQAGP
jgi:hypothetical protein